MTDGEHSETIQSWIRESHNKDQKTPWSFDLFQAGASRESTYTFISKEAREKVAYMGRNIEYPQVVKNAINPPEGQGIPEPERVYMGSLPLLKSFYCIVDARLYVWKIDDTKKVVEIGGEKERSRKDKINVVDCGYRIRDYLGKDFPYVLVVARGSSIQLYPVDKEYNIYTEEKLKQGGKANQTDWTRIMSSPITAITITKDGLIYAGTSNGQIIRLVYGMEENGNRPFLREESVVKFSLKREMSPCGVTPVAGVKRMFSSAVMKIVTLVISKTEKMYIAALYGDSHISFIEVDSEKMDQWSTDKTLSHRLLNLVGLSGSDQEKIVTIQALETDNDFPQFAAITNAGDRLIFTLNGREKVLMPERRLGPIDFSVPDHKQRFGDVVDAMICLSTTVLIFRQHIVVIRRADSAIGDTSMNEDVAIWEIEQDSVCKNLGFSEPYVSVNSSPSIWKHQMIWQHILSENAVGYIIGNTGIRSIKFATPADRLKDIIVNTGGSDLEKIRKEWGVKFFESIEGKIDFASTVVLVALKQTSQMDIMIDILRKFFYSTGNRVLNAENNTADKDEYHQSDVVVDACITCLQRILSGILDEPIFKEKKRNVQKSENVSYKVADAYMTFPLHHLRNLKKFVRQYSLRTHEETKKSEVFQNGLADYITWLIAVIKFIQKFHELDDEKVSAAMQQMGESTSDEERLRKLRLRERLKERFDNGDKNFRRLIEDMLCEFVIAHFTKSTQVDNDEWAKDLWENCRLIISQEDYNVVMAMRDFESKDIKDLEKANEEFKKYADGFSNKKYRHKELRLDLPRICGRFREKQYYNGIVELLAKIVECRDQNSQGLQWYTDEIMNRSKRQVSGRKDIEGMNAYDCDHKYYKHAFVLLDEERDKKARKALFTDNKDQLFHYVLYHRMLDTNRLGELLKLETPFIEKFLEELVPDHLWEYYSQRERYADSATHLLYNIDCKKATLDERIEWLERVINIARGAGLGVVVSEAQIKLKTALVQAQIRERLDETNSSDDGNVWIADVNTLLQQACKHNYWDLVLEIFSFTSFDDAQTKQRSIARVWGNMLSVQYQTTQLADVAGHIIRMTRMMEPENDVIKASIVVPIMEDFRLMKYGTVRWVIDTLLKCGVPAQNLADTYMQMARNRDITPQWKCDFIYCGIWLSEMKGTLIPDDLVNWFWINVDTACPYHEEAMQLKRNKM